MAKDASTDQASRNGSSGKRGTGKRATKRGKIQSAAAETADESFASRRHTSVWDRPGFLVRRLHQIHVAMFMEGLRDAQITPIQYGLLSILLDMPGLDQFSLAEEIGIDRANVADVLKRLESRKLVARVVDPHNKRRKLCLPTRGAVAVVAKNRERMQRAQERLLEPLSPEERQTFVDLLHRLVEANNVYGRTTLKPPRGPRTKGAR